MGCRGVKRNQANECWIWSCKCFLATRGVYNVLVPRYLSGRSSGKRETHAECDAYHRFVLGTEVRVLAGANTGSIFLVAESAICVCF